MATATFSSRRVDARLNPIGRLGWGVWRTLTSVRFAVLQISVLAIAGVIGAVMRQIPPFALHDPTAYANQVAQLHAAYDPLTILGLNIGPGMVEVFVRLGLFEIFATPWFVFLLTLLVASIVCCTLDRTPDMWRQAHNVRVAQPAPFFDTRLDNRASFADVSEQSLPDVARALRRAHYRVRELRSVESDGVVVVNLYGDRNQYLKLSTLATHLGLILFLGAAAITTGFGFETVVFLGNGQSAPVLPVGTPANLLVKNFAFEAPQRADGSFADFSTDLGVYQDGQLIARKTIRVNDPLEVNGYAFHQNTFGPSAELTIHDPGGSLVWQGPVLLDGAINGAPQGFMTIPGSDLGLLLVLDRSEGGAPVLALTGITTTPATGASTVAFLNGVNIGDTSPPASTAGYTITWNGAGAYTGMVIKRDPGQGLVWFAYLCLISGLLLTFYFPRRRLWARYEGGTLQLAMLADRYVETEREFAKFVDDLGQRIGGASTH